MKSFALKEILGDPQKAEKEGSQGKKSS